MTIRLSSMAGSAIGLLTCVLLVAAMSTAAHAAPASFTLGEPANEAYLDTDEPVLTWNTTSSSAGIDAYEVRVDGQSIGFVDPADCGSICAVTLPDPLSQGRHTWQVVAIDGADEETPSPFGAFTIDTFAPHISLDEGRRIGADNCATPTTGAAPVVGGVRVPGASWKQVYVISESSPFETSFRLDGAPVASLCGLPAGNHVLTVTVTDRAGNASTRTATVQVDAVSPRVTIEGPARSVTGTLSSQQWRAVVADGTAIPPLTILWQDRRVPNGFMFTGNSSVIPLFPFRSPGLKETVRVVVIDAEGDYGVGSIEHVSGGAKPAVGPVGLAIKATPKYVNDRELPLKLIWPSGAATFTLSDSSGLRTRTGPVATNVSWRLGGKGTSKRPTTIRVRFDWPNPGAVYEAKVVLDLERPKLVRALPVGSTLRVNARDRVSGVDRVQLAVDRRKPRSASFGTKLRVGSARWVRVSDRAGNFSAWVRIRRG